MPTQSDLADRLRALHVPGRPLLLPNAWDVASARLVEQAGYPAVATTSAGVAWSLGFPDGELISRYEMLAVIERVTRAVRVPVTADLEAGYGPTPRDAADTARGAVNAGAVGFNFEDSTSDETHRLLDAAAQAERVAAARAAADATGVRLVINARTDVFLLGVGAPETRLEETVRRLAAYRDAGADCLFAPGVTDRDTIAALVRELHAPVNVLAAPASPTVADLAALGVARISLGGGVMRVALARTRDLLRDLLASGNLGAIMGAGMTHAELQKLMA